MDDDGSVLPGTFNARDLGGLATADGVVRPGAVLRSDAPVALGDAGRAELRRLGVRTAIDLREPVERELDPADLAGLDITVVEQPIIGGGGVDDVATLSLDEVYLRLLETRATQLAGAVSRLAAADAVPALVFCSAGKDRTGLVTALLLAAVGVLDEEIVADYVRTEESMHGPFRAAIEARAQAAGISEQEIAVKIGAPAAVMRSVLGWLRREHGGAGGYLRAHGVTPEEIGSLRCRLVAA
jgi:protein-tyrosine phosphatase